MANTNSNKVNGGDNSSEKFGGTPTSLSTQATDLLNTLSATQESVEGYKDAKSAFVGFLKLTDFNKLKHRFSKENQARFDILSIESLLANKLPEEKKEKYVDIIRGRHNKYTGSVSPLDASDEEEVSFDVSSKPDVHSKQNKDLALSYLLSQVTQEDVIDVMCKVLYRPRSAYNISYDKEMFELSITEMLEIMPIDLLRYFLPILLDRNHILNNRSPYQIESRSGYDEKALIIADFMKMLEGNHKLNNIKAEKESLMKTKFQIEKKFNEGENISEQEISSLKAQMDSLGQIPDQLNSIDRNFRMFKKYRDSVMQRIFYLNGLDLAAYRLLDLGDYKKREGMVSDAIRYHGLLIKQIEEKQSLAA